MKTARAVELLVNYTINPMEAALLTLSPPPLPPASDCPCVGKEKEVLHSTLCRAERGQWGNTTPIKLYNSRSCTDAEFWCSRTKATQVSMLAFNSIETERTRKNKSSSEHLQRASQKETRQVWGTGVYWFYDIAGLSTSNSCCLSTHPVLQCLHCIVKNRQEGITHVTSLDFSQKSTSLSVLLYIFANWIRGYIAM